MKCFSVRFFSGLLALPLACFGWGREGHRIVAQIAAAQVNKHAQSEIAKLLDPAETMESIASWADEIRPQRPATGPWHYINLPISIKAGDWKQYCPPEGCSVGKIGELVAYLKSPAGSRTERAEALKFLIHLVGDLHQPLHSGDNHDRGGNDLRITHNGRPGNLHSLWDGALVVELEKQEPGFANDPAHGLGWFSRYRMRGGDAAKWAWQAHDESKRYAYGKLPADRPAAITEAYMRAATPTVRRQLQRGGIRLGKILNQIWP